MRYMTKNTTADALKKVEEIKKGYITGFFDAEGSVSITKEYALSALINQSFKPVLERIDNEFKSPSGIRVHGKEGYDKKGVHHKNSWTWRLYSDNALPFLEYVHEYSIEKRPQIELGIKYQKTMTSHKNSRSGGMFRLSQSEIQLREWFKTEIERLKHVNPTEQELRNYNNEIKKQSIPKDIRDGKQKTMFDTLDELYKSLGIDINEPEQLQTKQQTPQMPQYIQLGYIAGFFDGEAYIGISKGDRNNYSLHVTISNTNFDMLKMYESQFGGKIRKVRKEAMHHKEKFHWDINNFHALPFLKLIQPFTIVKREQINLAIEFQEWHEQIRIIKTPEQKKKAEWYYNELKDMKQETGEKISDNESIEEIQEPNPLEKFKETF